MKNEPIKRFEIGDKVKLVDYETYCKIMKVSPDNEKCRNHYNYMKKKEPLEIHWIWNPGEMTYSIPDNENDLRNGMPTEKYYYNIHTPRSKMYLFSDEELEPYVESTDEE